MSTLFSDLRQGLQEAIDYEKGIGKAKVTKYTIDPIKSLTSKEIRGIRIKAGMTQKTFADCMGVSVKTIEAWECGRTHPTGPAYRLMDIISSGHMQELSFIR